MHSTPGTLNWSPHKMEQEKLRVRSKNQLISGWYTLIYHTSHIQNAQPHFPTGIYAFDQGTSIAIISIHLYVLCVAICVF